MCYEYFRRAASIFLRLVGIHFGVINADSCILGVSQYQSRWMLRRTTAPETFEKLHFVQSYSNIDITRLVHNSQRGQSLNTPGDLHKSLNNAVSMLPDSDKRYHGPHEKPLIPWV